MLIRLTDERIMPIFKNNSEIRECISGVLETIENPDFILAGDFGELLAVKHYDKTPVTHDKFLVIMYKETSKLDGFILTAYFSRSINKKRRMVWEP